MGNWKVLLVVLGGITFLTPAFTSTWAAPIDNGIGIQPTSLDLETLSQAIRTLELDPGIKQVLSNPDQQILFKNDVSNEGLRTIKFQSYYKGLEVFGAMAMEHENILGSQITHSLARFDLDINPKLTAEQAVGIARSLHPAKELTTNPALKIFPSETQNSARLIYWVQLNPTQNEGGFDIIIDAHSGEVIANVSHDLEIAPIEVFQANTDGGQQVDPRSGAPTSFNLEKMNHSVRASTTSSDADEAARRALSNATRVLNYYSSEHGRNSFDNKGSASRNVVHAGSEFANAFWNSDLNVMAYGDGDGERTRDFTLGLDVAGHEMTHGVVQETAGLTYFSETGALNEAFADFFGKMIEGKEDWVLGRALFINSNDADRGIRNLANPGLNSTYTQDEEGHLVKHQYPSKMSEILVTSGTCDSTNDRCFVHANSTIPSHAAYLIYTSIGRPSAQKLMFITLTQYLTPRSDFRSFGNSVLKACNQALNTSECERVREQLASVGLLN